MQEDDELNELILARCEWIAQSHRRNRELIAQEMRRAERSIERSLGRLAAIEAQEHGLPVAAENEQPVVYDQPTPDIQLEDLAPEKLWLKDQQLDEIERMQQEIADFEARKAELQRQIEAAENYEEHEEMEQDQEEDGDAQENFELMPEQLPQNEYCDAVQEIIESIQKVDMEDEADAFERACKQNERALNKNNLFESTHVSLADGAKGPETGGARQFNSSTINANVQAPLEDSFQHHQANRERFHSKAQTLDVRSLYREDPAKVRERIER